MKKHYMKTGSKKVMSAVLVAATLMLGVTACGGSDEESKQPESGVVESTVESSVEESSEESESEAESAEGSLEEGTDESGTEPDGIETRTYVLEVDGVETEFEETLFRSESGYQVWYPTGLLEAAEVDGYDGFLQVDEEGAEAVSFVLVPVDGELDLDEMLKEAVAGYEEDAQIGEIQVLELEEDALLAVRSIEVSHAEGTDRFYAVSDGENTMLITVKATAEAMEEMGAHFDRMASTVSLGMNEPGAEAEAAGGAEAEDGEAAAESAEAAESESAAE